jgi:C1A family cysteine protease
MPNVYGRLPHRDDPRDFMARAVAPYTGAYVNLELGFPAPWDQGQLGACVEFGTVAAATFARLKAGLPDDPLSELFGYYAARARAGYNTDEDTGLEIRDGFASLAHDGVCSAIDWPYDVSKFAIRPPQQAWTDALALEATVYGAVAAGAVDDMIASGYPVVIGFDVYESFESDATASTGVMPVPEAGEQLLGGHCTVLVSTPKDGSEIGGGKAGTLYRRARNSWGVGWGDLGWYWHPLAAMNHASDFWQVTTVGAPLPPVPPNPTPGPSPTPGPTAEARALAAALRGDNDWVDKHHYGHTGTVARAARPWLESEGL